MSLEKYLENRDETIIKLEEMDDNGEIIKKCVVRLKDNILLLQYVVDEEGGEEEEYVYLSESASDRGC